MAFVFRWIPSAVRLSVAGGTAYGTAKVGVWSDSSESRDKLREVKKSLYEIEYPAAAVSKHSHLASVELPDSRGTLSSITLSAANTWNSAITRVCQSAIQRANSNSKGLHVPIGKLTQQLKKWTDK